MVYSDSELKPLMVLIQAGDKVAYMRLLSITEEIATRFLIQKGIQPIDIDDIVQHVLIAVHNAKHTYRQSQSCLSWLHAIIKHKLADFFRSRYRQEYKHIDQDLDLFLSEDSIHAYLELEDLRNVLNTALQQLSKIQRTVITQMKLEHRSIKEVAHQLGLSEANVKINAYRGYRRLKLLLVDHTDSLHTK